MNKIITKIKNASSNFSFKGFLADSFKYPLFLITHPIRGFDEFKREKKAKFSVALFYIIMMIITQTVMYNAGGFLVNKNKPNEFNFLLTVVLVVFPVILGVIGNWASTALMDGKGTMMEIFEVIGYSLFPYVWLGLFATLISNYITADELVFYNFLMYLGIGLTVYMMFFGLMGIHEYGLVKNIFMIIFTIVAIAVILFIILLFLSLIQYVYSFLASVIEEFIARYLCII